MGCDVCMFMGNVCTRHHFYYVLLFASASLSACHGRFKSCANNISQANGEKIHLYHHTTCFHHCIILSFSFHVPVLRLLKTVSQPHAHTKLQKKFRQTGK